MNILITNISYHCSIGVIKLIRRLNNDNYFIVGCSNIPYGYSSGSLLVDAFIEVSDSSNSKEYLKQLTDICERYNIDHIISTDENEQILFNTEKSYFQYKTILVSPQIVNLFTHKFEATKAVKNIGLKTPHIYTLSELKTLDNCKLIIRDNVSCCSYGIHIIENLDIAEIKKYLNSKSFAQEYIFGDEYTVDVLSDKNGIPINIIPRKRLSIRGGITYKCIIENNELLINECKKIYRHYKIPGFSNVQFILKNNFAYFIELNPRLGGTTIASSIAGDNLVELYLNHFVNNDSLHKSKIKWNTVVTRYYEETSFLLEDN